MKSVLVSVLVAAPLLAAFGFPTPARAAAPVGKTASPTAESKSKLAATYSLSTGQFVALIIPSLISNFHLVNAPVLAAYDPDEDKIEVLIFGQQATVDAARQAIEEFQQKLELIRNVIEITHELKLDDEDFSLGYYDISKDKLVLEWIDGEYKMH